MKKAKLTKEEKKAAFKAAKKMEQQKLTEYAQARGVLASDMFTACGAPAGWREIDGEPTPLWMSKFTTNESPVFISDGLTGKMNGIPAISTNCLSNPICQKRMQDKESICAGCFAAAELARGDRKAAAEHGSLNLYVLMHHIIPNELLPIFGNVRFVRIEWSGDIANENQIRNYINIINKNKSVVFAWWSKNIKLIEKIFDEVGKPENCILIQSSAKVNKEEKPASKYVDKVFTVYDKAYIQENNIDINCGARSCVRCQKCYNKNDKHKTIQEQKK